MTKLDDLDKSILQLLLEEPRAGMREYARILGVARGTVQSRLARLEREGVIASFAPAIDPAALGYTMLAFVHVQLTQGVVDAITRALWSIPEVIEAHSMAGDGDLLCRIVGRDSAHLESVIQMILNLKGVARTRSEIALRERVGFRTLPLVTGRGTAPVSPWTAQQPRIGLASSLGQD
ncbi:MAG: Lrp/AsnC family transcriptional regulator [Propionicimonas sp.]|nr:Lrp/AsnC family transcriptional regulator [Propionicimonas sp.]